MIKMYYVLHTFTKVSETPTILHPVGLKQQNVTAEFVPPSSVSNSCPELESHIWSGGKKILISCRWII